MKKLFALMIAALFAMSFVACGDDEESGNACEQLAKKYMETYEDYCADHGDCMICSEAEESTDEVEGTDDDREPTDEEIKACQAVLDDYKTLYEDPTIAAWDAVCGG